MFRNQYDSDITTWSPDGRLYQIEYAMEAVKQGSACVGLKSKTHAIVCTLKRNPSELSSYQKKILKIDDHMGVAIAGLTADARVLSRYMRTECVNHKYVYGTPMQVGRLVVQVADKSQVHTQRYGRRPYGVGMLVIGYDKTGAHLYETCPSGNYFDYKAQAIGARAQTAKTYLEKHFTTFENATLNELIHHGLVSLRETTQQDSEGLTIENTSVGLVGLDRKFEILEGEALRPYLQEIEETATRAQESTEASEQVPMDIQQ